MNNILDDTFIQNQYLLNRRVLFYTEIKRYALWVSLLLLYVFMMSFLVQKTELRQYQHIPFNYLLVNTLLIYAMVSCIFGVFIAAFEYKGFNYKQRFLRATVMLMASILSIISVILTLLVIISMIIR